MMNAEDNIQFYFRQVTSTLDRLDKTQIGNFIKQLLNAYNRKKTIYVFGNGGSSATASHICGDFVKGVSYGLKKRFKIICLNDNGPAFLAIANDISYNDIFIEQLKNFLEPEELVIGISGSGNSLNVVKALEYAKKKGAYTTALTGFDGGKIKNVADVVILAEINNMEVVEDIHLIIGHCIKNIIKAGINPSVA